MRATAVFGVVFLNASMLLQSPHRAWPIYSPSRPLFYFCHLWAMLLLIHMQISLLLSAASNLTENERERDRIRSCNSEEAESHLGGQKKTTKKNLFEREGGPKTVNLTHRRENNKQFCRDKRKAERRECERLSCWFSEPLRCRLEKDRREEMSRAEQRRSEAF